MAKGNSGLGKYISEIFENLGKTSEEQIPGAFLLKFFKFS